MGGSSKLSIEKDLQESIEGDGFCKGIPLGPSAMPTGASVGLIINLGAGTTPALSTFTGSVALPYAPVIYRFPAASSGPTGTKVGAYQFQIPVPADLVAHPLKARFRLRLRQTSVYQTGGVDLATRLQAKVGWLNQAAAGGASVLKETAYVKAPVVTAGYKTAVTGIATMTAAELAAAIWEEVTIDLGASYRALRAAGTLDANLQHGAFMGIVITPDTDPVNAAGGGDDTELRFMAPVLEYRAYGSLARRTTRFDF